MREIPPAIRRIGRLCATLEADATLREVLALPDDTWARIAEAARRGGADELDVLLDKIEEAAASVGLDGLTGTTREYRPLPGSPSRRTVSGWRCPHTTPCGRAEVGADPRIERRCELTGDPLAWASVTSG